MDMPCVDELKKNDAMAPRTIVREWRQKLLVKNFLYLKDNCVTKCTSYSDCLQWLRLYCSVYEHYIISLIHQKERKYFFQRFWSLKRKKCIYLYLYKCYFSYIYIIFLYNLLYACTKYFYLFLSSKNSFLKFCFCFCFCLKK